MRFDKIRADFKLKPGDELVHSFVCGSYKLEMPKDWEFLYADRKQMKVLAQLEHGPTKKKQPTLQQDIAIVGMSGRYPGANNLDQYWNNLKAGKKSFKDLLFDQTSQYRRNNLQDDSTYDFHHRGAFLDDVDCFDPLLFKISPIEAKSIDPQERLFMEIVWECLENGGYTGDELNRVSNKIGVFVGAMWGDYQHQSLDAWKDSQNILAISHHSSIANRISYFFDFDGPSIALDTSCSSAMTAIHYACNSIKHGECQAAIVGGGQCYESSLSSWIVK